MGLGIELSAPDAEALAPFGQFLTAPEQPGVRNFYSEVLREHGPQSAPVLHVNHVPETKLPVQITQVERHPFAAQCFIPLDVERYAVVVMPSTRDGHPCIAKALALLVPGTMGVTYKANVWHVGATVFDRAGHFAVLMCRDGTDRDDEFREIPPLVLSLKN